MAGHNEVLVEEFARIEAPGPGPAVEPAAGAAFLLTQRGQMLGATVDRSDGYREITVF